MHNTTFGITAFNRPRLLRQLIESIRKRYPHAPILVADNGDQHAALPDDVEVIPLPFDCGLSKARNALIDHLKTDYLLVLEDDFLFTSETDVEPLRRVLEANPDVGVAGGAIRGSDGRVTCYALDIEVCRDTMRVREATHRKEVTPCGVPYRLCDMVWNFALFRRDMLREHRWVDALKIGEHCPYFYEVKLGRRWRVASCSLPKIYHVPDRRPANYLKYRRRAAQYFQAYLAARGIRHYERVLPYHYEDELTVVPPVIVLAVGHSGTSVATRMLQQLGWNLGQPVDKVFAEHIEIRKLNRQVIDHGRLDHDAARRALSSLPMPWALKDPRFVQTLQHWLPLFAELDTKPVVLRLRRDLAATKHSYRHRGAPGDVERRIEQLADSRDHLYDLWPWSRFTLEYEKIAAAVSVFDLDRYDASRETLARLQTLAAARRPPLTQESGKIAVESDSGYTKDAAVAADSSFGDGFPFAAALANAQVQRSASHDSTMNVGSFAMDGSSTERSSVDLNASLPARTEIVSELTIELDSSVGRPVAEQLDEQVDSSGGELLEWEIRKQLSVEQRGAQENTEDGSES